LYLLGTPIESSLIVSIQRPSRAYLPGDTGIRSQVLLLVRLFSSLVKAIYYLSLLGLFSTLYTPFKTVETLLSLALLALRVKPRLE